MYTLGKRLYVNFLVYTNWFISISISQIKDHSVSVDQARYATYVVAKISGHFLNKIKYRLTS